MLIIIIVARFDMGTIMPAQAGMSTFTERNVNYFVSSTTTPARRASGLAVASPFTNLSKNETQ